MSQGLVSIVWNAAQVVRCTDRSRLFHAAWQLWSACRAHRDRVALTHTLAWPRRERERERERVWESVWERDASCRIEIPQPELCENKDNAVCVRVCVDVGARICHFIEVISIQKLSLPRFLLPAVAIHVRVARLPLSQLNLQKLACALCFSTASLLLLSSSSTLFPLRSVSSRC